MLPLYTDKPYLPQDTQTVIVSLLKVVSTPYKAYAPIFHILTLVIVALIAWRPARMGQVLAGYMGLNYLVIALAQGMGTTAEYGFVVHTGGILMNVLLGLAWLVVAFRNELQASFQRLSWQQILLLPLALLAFWGPYASVGNGVRPDFNPLLLLTSEYGITFCFTTPVFLFLLILFYPRVNLLAYRITAFNGLLFGLFNLGYWLQPELRWMGFLHLPLLIISIYALWLSRKNKKQEAA
jgi:hypothetical protein